MTTAEIDAILPMASKVPLQTLYLTRAVLMSGNDAAIREAVRFLREDAESCTRESLSLTALADAIDGIAKS